MFCPTKDKIPIEQKSNLIYEITCPGCANKYVGKTDRCLIIRLKEHGSRIDQPMHQHLQNCELFHDYVEMFNLPDVLGDTPCEIDREEHVLNAVLNNFRVIENCDNWSGLNFLEAYFIKHLSPSINMGLKASKELQLFG